MKILHVNRDYGVLGGVEEYLHILFRDLAGNGISNALVYESAHGADDREWQAELHQVSGLSSADRREQLTSTELTFTIAANFRPDVVYVHNVLSNGLIVQRLAEEWPTIRFVHTLDICCPGGGHWFPTRQRLCDRAYGLGCLPRQYLFRCGPRRPLLVMQAMQRMTSQLSASKAVRATLVDSRYMRDVLVQNGISEKQIHIIPTPVTVPPLTDVTPYDPQGPMVFAGRLVPEKGPQMAIEATAAAGEGRLVIAGDGPMRGDLEQLAMRRKVASRVEFLGHQSRSEISELYNAASLLVMPSLWAEPFGMVGPEALAYKRPVVGFGAGGSADWLIHGVTGLVASYGNDQALAEAIMAIRRDERLAAALGTAGRRLVKQRFTPAAHLRELSGLFARVLGPRERNSDETLHSETHL